MNPKAYCIAYDIKTADFIEKVREVAPKYSKVTHCMASDSKYGVVLRPCVVRHVRGNKENRTLPCQFTYRTTEGFKARLTAVREALCLGTMQELIGYAVSRLVDEVEADMKKAAAPAGTGTTAQEKKL